MRGSATSNRALARAAEGAYPSWQPQLHPRETLPVTDAPSTPKPISRRRAVLAGFAFFTAVGLLFFGSIHLDHLARDNPAPPIIPFIEEMTGAYTAGALLPLIVLFRRWLPLERGKISRRIPLYLLAALAYSALHTTLMALSRQAIFPLAGLGPYDYGRMPYRYAMELQKDVVWFCIAVTLLHLWARERQARARELAYSQLQARLAQAELRALRGQLQPHFLFNTLNTISSVMYDDVRAADALISRLADLLRLSLRERGEQEVTLAEEMEFLALYLEIMRARFGPRLNVTVDAESGTGGALVPHLLLQPLVENSIRHGVAQAAGEGHIAVRAARREGKLLLTVRDDGPGIGDAAEAMRRGVGLPNTAGRLAHLYGERGRFDLRNADGGGLLVTVEIPFRLAGAPQATA
jgi:two-component system LytT family sensor kinase